MNPTPPRRPGLEAVIDLSPETLKYLAEIGALPAELASELDESGVAAAADISDIVRRVVLGPEAQSSADTAVPTPVTAPAAVAKEEVLEASKAAVNEFCANFGLGPDSAMFQRAYFLGDRAELADRYQAKPEVMADYRTFTAHAVTLLRGIVQHQRIALTRRANQRSVAEPVLNWAEVQTLELFIGTAIYRDGMSYSEVSRRLENHERVTIDHQVLTEQRLGELTLSAFGKLNDHADSLR